MVGIFRLEPTKWFPNPHKDNIQFGFGLETAVNNNYTIVPICMYDEGQGDPTALETNPENAAFVVDQSPMVYPDSSIEQIFIEFEIHLNKFFEKTDSLHSLKFCYMPITMAFLEDYTAIDDLTSEETQDVLEMQTESTDRQGSPLYNNVKMIAPVGGTAPTLHADVPGLTTNQNIEGVTFVPFDFYNALHYKTISGKLKTLQQGLRWRTITKQHPIFRTRIRLNKTVKRANEYMFGGLLVGVPPINDVRQYHIGSETSNITHAHCNVKYRYNEWNQFFNFRKV